MQTLTCEETAELFELTFNAVYNYAREGKIDAHKETVKKKKQGTKSIWKVELTEETINFLNSKTTEEKPEFAQVKKSNNNRIFEGDCYCYRTDAMGSYLIDYYRSI